MFTKVLIFEKDPLNPNGFGSGSSGQYVGRSWIANPHLSSIGTVEIAEAIVHEAIHSVLYMQEKLQPWVTDPALYDPIPRIISPWSGQVLALRPYLQAAFVWYGLWNFWGLVTALGKYDNPHIFTRFQVCRSGFLKNTLIDNLFEFMSRIEPNIVDAIEVMQANVREMSLQPML